MVFEQFIQPIEKLVATKIGLWLKNIFEDFEEEKFVLRLSQGEITLENLHIRNEILDGLSLPLKPVLGTVERISVIIPWLNIRTHPIKLRVNGVLLLVASTDEVKVSDIIESEISVEQMILSGFEELKFKTRVALGKNEDKSAWNAIFNAWAERVFAYTIERVEFSLTNLHVRFEDHLSRSKAFAAGVTLESLEVKSATDEWSSSPFVDLNEGPFIRKLIRVDRFSIYWNTEQFLRLTTLRPNTRLKHMRDLVPSAETTPREHSFILLPTFVRVKLSLYRAHYNPSYRKHYLHRIDESIPHMDIQLKIENPRLSLDHSQYMGLVSFNNFLSFAIRRKPFLATRPRMSVRSNPRAWWGHAITCVLTFVLRRKSTFSWPRIKKRRDVRRMYLERYKRVMLDKTPSKEVISWLHDLERSLSSDDVMLFRMIAESRYGHLRDTKITTNVTVMDWVYSTAGRWWTTTVDRGEAWWLDRELQTFFTKLGEEYGDVGEVPSRANIVINVLVDHIGVSLLLDTDKRARVSTTDLSWSSGATQMATSRNVVCLLALDDVRLEWKTGMSDDPAETKLKLVVQSVNLLGSPHPDSDLTSLVDQDLGLGDQTVGVESWNGADTAKDMNDPRVAARKPIPRRPQPTHKKHQYRKEPLLELVLLSKTSKKTGYADKVLKVRFGRCVLRYNHECLERVTTFLNHASENVCRALKGGTVNTADSIQSKRNRDIRSAKDKRRDTPKPCSSSVSFEDAFGGHARRATVAPASRRNPYQTLVSQVRSDLENMLRYGHVAFDVDVSQIVFVIESVKSDLAIDFGRMRCAFVPRMEIKLPENKRHLICPTPGRSSSDIAAQLTNQTVPPQGHVILTMQGIRSVLVSKPRTWYSEIAVMNRLTVNPTMAYPSFDNSECQLLDGVSVWFDSYINSDHESNEIPKIAICGGMSHVNAAISSRKLSELLQLIVDSVPMALPPPMDEDVDRPQATRYPSKQDYLIKSIPQLVVNDKSDEDVDWDNPVGTMGGGPNTTMVERIEDFKTIRDAQKGATCVKSAKDCFSFTSFEIHGGLLAFNQYNTETGHLMEMMSVVIDPVQLVVNELRMSLHATMSALGMHVNLYHRPKVYKSLGGWRKQENTSDVQCYTLLRVRGNNLGDDGMNITLKLVDPASPTYLEHQCKASARVGLIQLNAEPNVYLDFVKRLSVIRNELSRWTDPVEVTPTRPQAYTYLNPNTSRMNASVYERADGKSPKTKARSTPEIAKPGSSIVKEGLGLREGPSPSVLVPIVDIPRITEENASATVDPVMHAPGLSTYETSILNSTERNVPEMNDLFLDVEKVSEPKSTSSHENLSGQKMKNLSQAAAEVEAGMTAAGLSSIASVKTNISSRQSSEPEEPKTDPPAQTILKPNKKHMATQRFRRMFTMIKKVAYGFYPPYRTNKANRMIHGHVSVVHVDVSELKFVLERKTAKVGEAKLANIHFDGRYSSNRELNFSVGNLSFKDCYNKNHHNTDEVIWTELDEVVNGSVIHVHDIVNKTHNVNVRVVLRQFNVKISQSFLNPFLLWCTQFVPVSHELSQPVADRQADAKQVKLITEVNQLKTNVTGTVNIEGDLPLCLIYCGMAHKNTHMVYNLGHLRIRTKRTNKGSMLLHTRDERQVITSMNRIKLDVSSMSARFARVLNLEEADHRKISYHHNARFVFVEQRTLIDTCEYHAFARIEVNEPKRLNEVSSGGNLSHLGMYEHGVKSNVRHERECVGQDAVEEGNNCVTTITRVSCVVDRISFDVADRDVKVMSSVVNELLSCIPETEFAYDGSTSPTPLRTVRSLGGRRMSVAAFEGSRSRTSSVNDMMSGSKSSFSAHSILKQLADTGLNYQAYEIDFNVQTIQGVFYYQRENEYLRERGSDFCKILGGNLVVHTQYTSDGNAFLSVELQTLKLTDWRSLRAGEAFLDVFTHDPTPIIDEPSTSQPTDICNNNNNESVPSTNSVNELGARSSSMNVNPSQETVSASVFEDALKRTPANESGRTAKAPVSEVFQNFFSLRLVKRSAMHNLEMVLQRPRFFLNIDFINAFLVYLTPVESGRTVFYKDPSLVGNTNEIGGMVGANASSSQNTSGIYGPLKALRDITWSAYIEFECIDTQVMFLETVTDENSHTFLANTDLSVRTSISAGAGLEVNCVADLCVVSFDLLSREETELQVVKPLNIRQHIACDEDFSASLQVTNINVTMTYYDVKAMVVMLKSVELPDKLVVVTEECATNRYEEDDIDMTSWYLADTQEEDDELDEEAKELRARKKARELSEKEERERDALRQASHSRLNSRLSSRRNSMTTGISFSDSQEQDMKLQQVSAALVGNNQPKSSALLRDSFFSEVFDISIGTIQILFIDDSDNLYIPVFTIKTSIHADVRNWSNALDGRAQCSLICTYYNARQCIWEPIVEPSYEDDQVGRRFGQRETEDGTVPIDDNPWTIRTEVSRITEMSTSLLYVDVVAEKRMNVTITQNMLETWNRVSASLEDDYNLTLMGELNKQKDALRQSPVRLVNNTGCTITLLHGETKSSVDSKGERPPQLYQTVRDNDQVDVWLQGDSINCLSPFSVLLPKSKKKGRKVDITIEGWSAVTDVDIEMTGEYRYNVMRMADGRISRLIIEVTYQSGAKVVRMRSAALLKNNLELSLDISYMTDMGDVSTTIAANSDLALPLDTKVISTIRVRPSINHQWCDPLKLVLPDVLDVLRDDEDTNEISKISDEDSKIVVEKGESGEIDCDVNLGDDLAEKNKQAIAAAKVKSSKKQKKENGYSTDVYLKCPKLTTTTLTRGGPEPPFIVVCGKTRTHAEEAGYRFNPPVVINNMLPLQFRAHFTDRDTLHKDYTGAIEPGGHCCMHIDVSREKNPSLFMKLPRYGTGEQTIRTPHGELDRFFEVSSNQQGPLNIGLHWERNGKALQVTVFVHYWIMNKTSLPIVIKQAGLGRDPSRCPPFESPILFSYAKEKTFVSNAVCLSVNGAENGEWSKKFNLDKIGTPQVLYARGRSVLREAGPQVGKGPAISEEEVLRDHQFGMSVEFGPIQLTKIVTLKPHLLIVNNSLTKLRIANRYCLKTDNFEIKKGDAKPFYWSINSRGSNPLAKADRFVCVRGMITGDDEEPDDDPDRDYFVQSDTSWSPPFMIDQPGNFIVKLGPPLLDEDDPNIAKRKPAGHRLRVLRVTVTLNVATVTVILRDDYYQDAVRIENHCSSIIEVRESKSKERIIVEPGRAIPYCYDDPVGKAELQWRPQRAKKWVTVDMSMIKREFTMHKDKERERILQSIPFPDGPTRILVVTDQTRMVNTILDSFASSISSATESTAPSFELHLNCVGMGVSLVARRKPIEILYMQIDGVFMDYVMSQKGCEMVGRIQHFQIDNQLATTPFPVLLTVTSQPGILWNDAQNPLVFVKIIKTFSSESNLQVYPYVFIRVRPLSIQLEENILLELLHFASTDPLDNALVSRPVESMERAIRCCAKPLMAAEASEQVSQSVYLDQFYIAPVRAQLSFALAGDDSSGDTQDSSSPVIILLRSIGGSVSNITRAPIVLKSAEMSQTMTTQTLFMNQVGRHYRRLGLQQIYKVFGSVELLGNPVATVNEVAFGFSSFGSQIANGARNGHLNYGIAGGFKTLGAYSMSGVLGAIVRITMSFGNLVSLATFDKHYLDARRRRTKNLSNSASENFYVGGYLFVQGMVVGVCGVILKPVKGGLHDGAPGVIKGFAKGAIGFFVRPALAVFDVITYSMNGIVTLATKGRWKGRIRPPRYIDTDRIIRPFDMHSSTGSNMLTWVRNGKFINEEYVDHVDLSTYTGNEHHAVVLVTKRHFFLIQQIASKNYVKKLIRLTELEGRAVSARGIELHLKQTDTHGVEMILIKTYGKEKIRNALLDLLDEMGIKDTTTWLGDVIRPRLGMSGSSSEEGSAWSANHYQSSEFGTVSPVPDTAQNNNIVDGGPHTLRTLFNDSDNNCNEYELGSLDTKCKESQQAPHIGGTVSTLAPSSSVGIGTGYDEASLLNFSSPQGHSLHGSDFGLSLAEENEFGKYDDLARLRNSALKDLVGENDDESSSSESAHSEEGPSDATSSSLDTIHRVPTPAIMREESGNNHQGNAEFFGWDSSSRETARSRSPRSSYLSIESAATSRTRPESYRSSRTGHKQSKAMQSNSVTSQRRVGGPVAIPIPPGALRREDRPRQGAPGSRASVSFGDLPYGAGEHRRNLSSPPPNR
eukprot:CFRG3266T1